MLRERLLVRWNQCNDQWFAEITNWEKCTLSSNSLHHHHQHHNLQSPSSSSSSSSSSSTPASSSSSSPSSAMCPGLTNLPLKVFLEIIFCDRGLCFEKALKHKYIFTNEITLLPEGSEIQIHDTKRYRYRWKDIDHCHSSFHPIRPFCWQEQMSVNKIKKTPQNISISSSSSSCWSFIMLYISPHSVHHPSNPTVLDSSRSKTSLFNADASGEGAEEKWRTNVQ